MKKSRIAKLALMGASITALAATLTTSTYAWYVSNKTAKVDQLSGGVSANAGDGSIGVSKTGKNGTYFPSIAIDALAAGKLSPVHSTDGLTFHPLGAANAQKEVTVDTASDASGSVYSIVFYIKSDAHVTVTPTLKIVNAETAAANLPTQIAYKEIGANGAKVEGAAAGQEFTVDACRAIYASMTPEKGSFNTDSSYKAGTTQATRISAPSYLGSTTFVDGVTSGDAHSYYKLVTGETILDAAKVSSAFAAKNEINAAGNLDLEAGLPYKLTFNIWLDGGDTDCFNCCAGQNITVDFSFAVASTVTTPEP